MQIDHNPNEKRVTNHIWWVIWPLVAAGWVGSYLVGLIQWHSVFLGGFTGLVLATWATEITGNKVPESWTRKLGASDRGPKLRQD